MALYTSRVMMLFAPASTQPAPLLASELTTSQLFDNKMFSAMRIVLAASALLIISIDPSQPDRFVHATYSSLILYTTYSCILYALAAQQRSTGLFDMAHWLDVAWYTLLICLSSGTNSIFFFGFLFAVLVAAFRWGFASGLTVSLVSAVLFTLVGFATASTTHHFELNRFLLQPTYLLVIGAMIAYRGGIEIKLRRRNQLLKEVTTLANPRFGVDRTIGSTMKRLCLFYGAETCLMITTSARSPGAYVLRRADRHALEGGVQAKPIAESLSQQLLQLPPNYAVVYRSGLRWGGSNAAYYAYDTATHLRILEGRQASETLATLLEAASFITVPLRFPEATGRLFITGGPWTFQNSDVELLLQVVEHLVPVLDNIRLVDRLASHAAEEERQRIARDIHDSIIQPYIGLRLGLAATRQELLSGGEHVAADLDRLLEMTATATEDLREYVRSLRDKESAHPGRSGFQEASLVPAVQRYVKEFAVVTGIHVEVKTLTPIAISERLAGETFQMVVEGLSNIRRHTQAENATLLLQCTQDDFILEICNSASVGVAVTPFTPNSLTERARALGGQVQVESETAQGTLVKITIPL